MDSSIINLGSPKKENPSRSKRLSLLGKTEKDINPNKLDAELFSFGKPSINSRKKLRNEKNEEDNNIKYKILIKKISSQLRKRVKLPTCKIIKIYQPYRNLILRIAEGIKKTSCLYVRNADRFSAIKHAVEYAEKDDIIVICGKGDEDYQEIKGVKYPMDERVLIAEILSEAKE
jgi:hypothetical protein